MNIAVIGCGACGNKAVESLVTNGFPLDDTIFVNSTMKDIKEEFASRALIFGKGRSGGCGKERDLGKKLLLADMQSGDFSIDEFIESGSEDGKYDMVVITSSTEGGSGSASLPILAKYIHQVCGLPVVCVLFFGFGDDARGYRNSVEICKELEEDYGVTFIKNSSYLSRANGNRVRAEGFANLEFVRFVKALCADGVVDSFQNIDETDLYKVITTPGYMTIDQAYIDRFKNVDQYNKFMTSYLDETVVPDAATKSAKRIAAFFSTKSDCIDFNGEVLKDRFGTPYEFFTHIQEPVDGDKEFIRWIVTGQKLPIDDVKAIYENYMEATKNVDKKQDSFFDQLSVMGGEVEDDMFNMMSRSTTRQRSIEDKKSAFFNGFTSSSSGKAEARDEY